MTDIDQADDEPSRDPATVEQLKRAAQASVDDTVAASFPASDPPAVWMWEVAKPRAGSEDEKGS